jgi:hypothetical protein
MTLCRMRCVGLADGRPYPHTGRWLCTFDPEANDGMGRVTWTDDLDHALLFPSAGAAHAYWMRVPTNRWLRPDGKPNRPLTAFHVEVVAA